jgi:hypothetical protein
MKSKSLTTTTSEKANNDIPLDRPANGWNYQCVATSPGDMFAQEFLKPLGLSQNQLAMNSTFLQHGLVRLYAASESSHPTRHCGWPGFSATALSFG